MSKKDERREYSIQDIESIIETAKSLLAKVKNGEVELSVNQAHELDKIEEGLYDFVFDILGPQ